MAQTNALTNGEVQELVYDWFRKLTDKVALEELLPLLSSDSLEIVFPEKTIRNYADFKTWYEDVTHLFFDQIHDVKMLAIDPAGDCSYVSVIVNWQARTWKPPSAYSEHQSVYVHQDWTVKKDSQSGKAVIARYHVGAFDPVRM